MPIYTSLDDIPRIREHVLTKVVIAKQKHKEYLKELEAIYNKKYAEVMADKWLAKVVASWEGWEQDQIRILKAKLGV